LSPAVIHFSHWWHQEGHLAKNYSHASE